MNAYGCLTIIPREINEYKEDYYIKLWYHLFSAPKTIEQFYQINSFVNIYINEIRNSMKYQIPCRTGILEHIETNLV